MPCCTSYAFIHARTDRRPDESRQVAHSELRDGVTRVMNYLALASPMEALATPIEDRGWCREHGRLRGGLDRVAARVYRPACR